MAAHYYAALALLAVEIFAGVLWEPACGDGAISRSASVSAARRDGASAGSSRPITTE